MWNRVAISAFLLFLALLCIAPIEALGATAPNREDFNTDSWPWVDRLWKISQKTDKAKQSTPMITRKALEKVAPDKARANAIWDKLSARLDSFATSDKAGALKTPATEEKALIGGETGFTRRAIVISLFESLDGDAPLVKQMDTAGATLDRDAIQRLALAAIVVEDGDRPSPEGGAPPTGSKGASTDNPHGGAGGKSKAVKARPLAPADISRAANEWGKLKGSTSIPTSWVEKLRSGNFADQWAAADWFVKNFTAEQIEKALAEPAKYGIPENVSTSDSDGFDILTAANRANREGDPAKLRQWAYDGGASVTGALKRASERELLRRTNLSATQDPVGSLLRDDFKFTRPELLLPYQKDAGGKDVNKAADAIADLMGSQNTAALVELAKKADGRGGNDEAKAYAKRAKCAAHITLAQRKADNPKLALPGGFTPDPDKACEGIADFKKAYEEKFAAIKQRNRDFRAKVTDVIKAGGDAKKEGDAVKAARRWLFEEKDPKTGKPRFNYENIADYLAQRVATAENPQTPEAERKAAYDEAVALGKILAWKDPATGNYVLNLTARDSGFKESDKQKRHQSLVLGKNNDQIFGALSRFSDRSKGDLAPADQTASVPLQTRPRLQSFAIAPDHAAHLRNNPQILAATGDGFGPATIGSGGVNVIGDLATVPRPTSRDVAATGDETPREESPTTETTPSYDRAAYERAVAKCALCHTGEDTRTPAQIARVARRGRMSGSPLSTMGTDNGDENGNLTEAEIKALQDWARTQPGA